MNFENTHAEVLSGTCGDDVTWVLDPDTGVLTISGNGNMYDYYKGPKSYPWYSNLNDIKKIDIEYGVTNIGAQIFWDYSSLTDITIADSVTSIGEYAFCGCNSLTSITIPNSVTSIGEGAFSDLSSLTSIDLPNSITSIEYATFADCSSLTTLTIPNSVTSIGESAFYCSGLTEITIPSSVTSIDIFAFSGCDSLTSITIPDSVTSLGDAAFMFSTGLTTVTIPNSITSIGDSTFNGCSSLTTISIPDSVTSIGYGAFADCSSLTSITIPDSVTSIDDDSFVDCSDDLTIYGYAGSYAEQYANDNDIAFVIIEDTPTDPYSGTCGDNLTWQYDVESGMLTISGSGEMYELYESGGYSWPADCKSIVIEDGVTSIASHAFENLSSLENIVIPDTVTTIGENAFKNDEQLTICAPCGSVAYNYSNTNQIPFVSTGSHDYIIKDVDLSCDSKVTYICQYCGDTYEKSYGANHNYELIGLSGNCDHLTVTYKCSKCGDIKTVNTSIEHTYELVSSTVNCKEEIDVYKCKSCGEIYEEEKEGAGQHSYELVSDTATCTKAGTATYKCSVCGDTYTEASSAKGHTRPANITTKTTAATCTKAGSITETYTCPVCNKKVTVKTTIPALGHHLTDVTTVEATYSAAGYTSGYCTNCQKTIKVTIPKLVSISMSKCTVTVTQTESNKLNVEVIDPSGNVVDPSNYTVSYPTTLTVGKKVSVKVTGVTANGYSSSKSVKFQVVM